jgi:hypothetical protein
MHDGEKRGVEGRGGGTGGGRVEGGKRAFSGAEGWRGRVEREEVVPSADSEGGEVRGELKLKVFQSKNSLLLLHPALASFFSFFPLLASIWILLLPLRAKDYMADNLRLILFKNISRSSCPDSPSVFFKGAVATAPCIWENTVHFPQNYGGKNIIRFR